MNKNETDISIIRKYLNGELDARAMHQLEKRAQDDPFLMDAIEGYEKAAPNQNNHLNDLATRLQERIAPKKARIIPFRMISIAASVLVVLSIGGWLLYNNQHTDKSQLTATIAPAIKKYATIDSVHTEIAKQTPLADLNPSPSKTPSRITGRSHVLKPVPNAAPVLANIVAKKDSVTTDSTPLNEMVVMQYTATASKETKEIAATKKVMDTTLGIKKQQTTIDNVLIGKVAGVNTDVAKYGYNVPPAGSNYLYDSNRLARAYIKGRVIDKGDGSPIPGATVSVAGSNKTTQTDVNGFFNMNIDSNKTNSLVINYIGYQSQRISANNRDSIKTIALQPDNKSLSEVVVTGYATQRKTTNDDDAVFTAAAPRNGWSSYKKYLKEKAVSPDGKTGTVKLAVTISSNGTIANVKVLKGLSTVTDQKAVDLINNGPQWSGSSDRRAETVTVRVKFGN